MQIEQIENFIVDECLKGMPGGMQSIPLGKVKDQNWNILNEDLPLPLAVLKQTALEHNGNWMKRFTELYSLKIAPHGKTTMSPQLFQTQLEDGAWAITLANVSQIQVARHYGIQRILLANQLIGKQPIRYILDELRRDPEFDFFCLVDSLDSVHLLAEGARKNPINRPIQVLLEVGFARGRTGCRTIDDCLAVCRAVNETSPLLELCGVEGFEGIIHAADQSQTETEIRNFLDFLVNVAETCTREQLFREGPVILSAGGSAYFDMVPQRFCRANLGRDVIQLIRSGCYISHDSILYHQSFEQMLDRSPELRKLGDGLQPAFEVWAYVQSRPETSRIILSLGKRDCSYDAGWPPPLCWFRPGMHDRPAALTGGHKTVQMNDQHTYLDVPPDSPLRVGDMVSLGVSHPCFTFNAWQVIPVIDNDYNVISMIRTFF